MEKTLQLILQKLEFLESQTNENTQLLKAVINRQEEIDAKLDTMAMDIHKMHGMVTINTEKIAEMSEVINELQHIEHQQEETLNILSRRSLQQEEKIRRLKQ